MYTGKKKIVIKSLGNILRIFARMRTFIRGNFDYVVLNGMLVVMPYLAAIKLNPFIKPKKKIIITFFFLHHLGRKRIIQRILKFLFSDEKIVLTLHSRYDLRYFQETVGITKTQTIILYHCQDAPPVDDAYGRGEEYIFAGGYTNRDYNCLLEAARQVNFKFIIACFPQNEMSKAPANVSIVTNLKRDVFNGYLKNAKILIVPLKEDVGSSGQAVAVTGMSLEKPIIYSDADCLADYFTPMVGIAYKLGDAADLAKKINGLIEDSDKCNVLGKGAYAHYDASFRRERYYRDLIKLFT